MNIKFYLAIFLIILFIKNNYAKPKKKFPKKSQIILLSDETQFKYKEIKNLIIFGDSHSSTFTNYTDMTYSQNIRGKNWPLFLIELNNMKLWNFSYAGSVVDLKIVRHKNVIDFLEQYELFYERMAYGKEYHNEWNSNNALIIIYIGLNDIFHLKFKCKHINDNYCKLNDKSVNENINDITNIMFNTIEKMYEVGVKNFMIMNIPPFHLAPVNRNNKYQFVEQAIPYFNSILIKKAKHLFNKFNDINIIVYDTNNEYKYIINNYKNFMFLTKEKLWKDNQNDDKDKYLWRDHFHISEKGNKIIAKDINDLLCSINK